MPPVRDAAQDLLDDLRSEGPRLRRLAQVLAGSGDADDAVQQAFLQVLERGEGRAERSPGWWFALLRNAVANMRRGDRRRQRRERAVARGEAAVPSSRELMEREERRRALVAAVDALPPDLRAVVLLRFFDDLPPRAIAARLGVPATTVWSRLRNALQRLRSQLDAERGERRAWLSPLFAGIRDRPSSGPIPVATSTSLAWNGAVLMTSKKLVLVGAVALAAAAWFAVAAAPWRAEAPLARVGDGDVAVVADRGANAAPTPVTAAGGHGDRVSVPVGAALEAEAATGSVLVHARFAGGDPAAAITLLLQPAGQDRLTATRRLRTDTGGTVRCAELPAGRYWLSDDRASLGRRFDVAVGAETEVEYELGPGIDLTGVVVDPTGAPVAGALVEVAPLGMSDFDAEVLAITGADGRFAVRAAPQSCLVGARAFGFASSPLQSLVGRDGNDAEVRLELSAPGGAVDGIVVDRDGRPVAGAIVRVGAGRTSGLFSRREGAEPIPAQVRCGADGRFRAIGVAAGAQPVAVRAPGTAPWVGRCEVVASAIVTLRIELTPGTRLEGVVRDDTGAPVAGAELQYGEWTALEHLRTVSSADGSYALDGLPAGAVTVRVAHDRAGTVERSLELEPGRRTLDFVLQRGRELRGRVVDERGEPVVAQLEVGGERPEHREWFAVVETDADGGFAVPNCPPTGTVRLSLRGQTIADTRRTGIDPAAGAIELRVQRVAPPSAFVCGRVLDPDGAPLANARVSVGRRLFASDNDGHFEIGPVRPGTLRLWVSAAGFPEVVVDGIVVAAEQRTVVDDVRLQRGGRARVDGVDPDVAKHFRIEAAAGTGRWGIEGAGDATTHVLAPGDYRLFTLGDGIARQVVPFRIHVDAVTPVPVTLLPAVRVRIAIDLPAGFAGAESDAYVALVLHRDGVRVGHESAAVRRGEPCAVETWLAVGDYTLTASLGPLRGQASLTVDAVEGDPLRVSLR